MKSFVGSKALAWIFLIIMLALTVTVMVMKLKTSWIELTDIFCGYMCAFMHLASLYVRKMNAGFGKSFDRVALIFGVMAIVAVFVLYWNKIF